MSLQLTELVKRPAVGDTGKPIRVRSNFFVITAFANQSIHHYDVTIEPAIKNPTLIDKIWQTFKETSSQGILAAIKVVFDGGKNVFSPEPLDLGEAQNRKFEVYLSKFLRKVSKDYLFYRLHFQTVDVLVVRFLVSVSRKPMKLTWKSSVTS